MRSTAGEPVHPLSLGEPYQSTEAISDIHKVLLVQFIASYDTPPDELILDFDATDDSVHGPQEARFSHGYCNHYCFFPLYVFCGDQLLVSYLRSSQIDGAKHAWAILSLLVKRLRQAWPEVHVIFRGDSGFCLHLEDAPTDHRQAEDYHQRRGPTFYRD